MMVPEAAMDKDDRVPLGQNQVRLPGESFDMKPVPQPFMPKQLPDLEFRCRALGANPAHQKRTLFSAHHINHIPESSLVRNS